VGEESPGKTHEHNREGMERHALVYVSKIEKTT
jgi:hypothetical protein